MNSKQIVCTFCKQSPAQSVGFLTKTDCCRLYTCRACKIVHICYPPALQAPSRRLCSRCEVSSPEICCQDCASLCFCFKCSQELHQDGKFSLHCWKTISDLSEETKTEPDLQRPQYLETERVQTPTGRHLFKTAMTIINISQAWDKIINQLQGKFTELFDSLKDKQSEIVEKLQHKKLSDLKAYEELLKEYLDLERKNMKKSMQIDKIEGLRSRLRSYEDSFLEGSDGSKVSKFNLNISAFQSVMASAQKIDIKGLVIKVSNKVDHGHRSAKRSSMMFGGSGAQSPSYLKTPKNVNKERSTSTLEIQLKETNERMNEEEEEQIIPPLKHYMAGTKSKPNLNISITKNSSHVLNKTKNKIRNNQSINSHLKNVTLNTPKNLSTTPNDTSLNNKLTKVRSEKMIACKSPKNLKNYFNNAPFKGIS